MMEDGLTPTSSNTSRNLPGFSKLAGKPRLPYRDVLGRVHVGLYPIVTFSAQPL